MGKFMVVSGFLGAGKTTTMVALTNYYNRSGRKAAMLANDLGAKNLVDAKFAALSGEEITEITGNCICYQTENLVDKLRRWLDYKKADMVMSDIPGCGVGALDHVYHKLRADYGEEFDLAPFLVIADPERLRTIMPEHADINLPQEMEYLFRSQLMEADVVVLNKTDLLTEEEIARYKEFLQQYSNGNPVFAISALNRTGIEELAEYLISHDASMKQVDIGYGGAEFVAAENKLCWYNRQFFVKGAEFDGNQCMVDFINIIRELLQKAGGNVPHLKVFAEKNSGDCCKFSLIGVDYDIIEDKKMAEKTDNLSVIVNARAACPAETLENIMNEALDTLAKNYSLEKHIYFTECFGMMDEGRF